MLDDLSKFAKETGSEDILSDLIEKQKKHNAEPYIEEATTQEKKYRNWRKGKNKISKMSRKRNR